MNADASSQSSTFSDTANIASYKANGRLLANVQNAELSWQGIIFVGTPQTFALISQVYFWWYLPCYYSALSNEQSVQL